MSDQRSGAIGNMQLIAEAIRTAKQRGYDEGLERAAQTVDSWGDQCAGGSGREVIQSGPRKRQRYGEAYYNLANSIRKLIGSELVFDTDKEKRLVAQARLMEFDLIKRERPLDPTYWDKHHRAELELLASKENEAEDSSPATDTQHWPGCPRKGGIGECDCTGDFSGAKP